MCYFISDKARKFSKSFRHAMITGEIYKKNGKKEKIPDTLRLPFWKLNKFITASLIGWGDPSYFMTSQKGNTNILIKEIYDLMKLYDSETEMIQPGEFSNPRKMYLLILGMFKKKIEGKGTFKVSNKQISYNRDKFNAFNNGDIAGSLWEKKPPHILGINLDEDIYQESSKGIGKKLVYKIGKLEYKLDSIGIRDTSKKHISGLLTINGEDYVYDGGNHTVLVKQKWRHLLNKDQDFKIGNEKSKLKYNFKKSVLNMVYYRTK